MIERIITHPDPYEPFLLSQGIKASGWLFISGQAGADENGKIVQGGFLAQGQQAFANLRWALPSALNGAILQSIQLRVGSNPSLGTDQQNFSLAPNVTNQALGGLKPNTTYYAQVWSQSNNGLGSASPIISFTTTGGSGGVKPEWIKVNGVWKKVTQVWIKVNGVWKPVTTSWQKRGGVWRAQ